MNMSSHPPRYDFTLRCRLQLIICLVYFFGQDIDGNMEERGRISQRVSKDNMGGEST